MAQLAMNSDPVGEIQEVVVFDDSQMGLKALSWLEAQQIAFAASGDEHNQIICLG